VEKGDRNAIYISKRNGKNICSKREENIDFLSAYKLNMTPPRSNGRGFYAGVSGISPLAGV
jgi:hypothetical protein